MAQLFEERRNFPAAIAVYSDIATRDPDTSLAARAAQGQIRCLLRLSDRAAAASMILQFFSAGRLAKAADLQGRLIAADEHLLALRLSGANDRGRTAIADRLIGSHVLGGPVTSSSFGRHFAALCGSKSLSWPTTSVVITTSDQDEEDR